MAEEKERRRTTRILGGISPKRRRTTRRLRADDPLMGVHDPGDVLLAIIGQLAMGEPLGRSFTKCLGLAAQALNAEVLSVLLLDETNRNFTFTAGVGFDPAQVAALPVTEGMDGATLTKDVRARVFEHDRRLLGRGAVAGSPLPGATLCLPMVFRERVMGFLTAAGKKEGEFFTYEEQALGRKLATLLALAAGSGIPREDIMARERIERAFQYAHTLQRCFTPYKIPESEGIRITVRRNSSLEMSGDFYDVIRLSAGRVALAMGNTSGRGVEAGFGIACTVMELRGALAGGLRAAEALQTVNALLVDQRHRGLLVNMALVILDCATGEFDLTSAGNIRFYLLSPEAHSFHPLDATTATPLGILAEWKFKESRHTLPVGGALLAHTAGLMKCVDDRMNTLPRASLEGALLESLQTGRPAADLLMERLRKHAGPLLSGEEVTLCAIDRLR
ncbi:MAG: SpoIIE family protein phosphatase [Planctomycetota bacterium]